MDYTVRQASFAFFVFFRENSPNGAGQRLLQETPFAGDLPVFSQGAPD